MASVALIAMTGDSIIKSPSLPRYLKRVSMRSLYRNVADGTFIDVERGNVVHNPAVIHGCWYVFHQGMLRYGMPAFGVGERRRLSYQSRPTTGSHLSSA